MLLCTSYILLVHCGAFKDPTDTCILHILWQLIEHAINQHTSYHFKDPSISTSVIDTLHTVTDHMTEIKSWIQLVAH